MRLPLASLRRHETHVVLVDRFAWTSDSLDETAGGGLAPLRFQAFDEAVLYLRFWKLDAGAMAGLREALWRHRWRPVAALSDDAVIEALADDLTRGSLLLAAEPFSRRSTGVPISVPAVSRSAGEEGRAAALAPTAPRAVPLLPKLVEVQIEGAQVLPEVMQTLEKLEATMAAIEVATVSLEPAPAGVPPIDTALRDASGSITTALDEI